MDKMDPRSMDIVTENICQLRQLFPEAFTEKKVDFKVLKEILGEYVDDSTERYNFTWNGKSKARMLAQTPSIGTLRPCKKESSDWDTTQNLFIEGDNLEVLKLLQKSYHKKIKMIYIDPPYNTGKDFVYRDDFKDNIKNYKKITGQVDRDGRNYSINPETSGRYHSDWLSMMYPRLKLARNLLRDDGVIFISIDDSEQANLNRMCDEIFGEENFVETMVWKRRTTPPNDRVIGCNHEYALVYSKDISSLEMYLKPRTKKILEAYVNLDNDSRGSYRLSDLSGGSKGGRATESCIFPIIDNTGNKHMPPQNKYWLYNEEKIDRYLKEGRIGFRKGSGYPFLKRYLSEVRKGVAIPTILYSTATSQDSAKEIRSMFGSDIFEFPKPTEYLKIMVQCGILKDDLILDFFSGSAATAHAVMQLNAQDGGNRKFIMVQLPEDCDKKSVAFKAGYENIAEIGKERIRRAAAKIREENHNYNGDLGFKVFKLDSTNIKPWETDPNLDGKQMEAFVENIKTDRDEQDVIYEILLKYGLDLTLPITEHTIAGQQVFSIGEGALITCLSDSISSDVVKGIVKLKDQLNPEFTRVVFKDAGFEDDVAKTNAVQTLKQADVADVKSL